MKWALSTTKTHRLWHRNLTLLALLGVMSGSTSIGRADAKILRIGYQKSGAFLLVRSDGSLEAALAPLGYRLEWKEFSAGPPLIEALNAGSIDVGHSGDCPLIAAQSAGVPLLYFGCTRPSPGSAAIIVPNGSPLRSAADLKGKRVAFAKGSSAHYLVARVLDSAGLSLADIQPIYLNPPDARAAFQSGTVDAWSIWDPFFAAAELDSGARVFIPSTGISPHREFYFGRGEYLQEHSEVVEVLLVALHKAAERMQNDPIGTADYLSEKLGVQRAIMERSQLRNTRTEVFPLTSDVVAEQQKVANFLFKAGVIPRQIEVADAVFAPSHFSGGTKEARP